MEFNSLNKKSEFIELKKFGKRINHRFVSITYVEKQKEDFKLGFQISKKSGNAVFRNKIKRRLRSIALEAYKKININLKYSYIFIAKKNVFDGEFKLIKEQIIRDVDKIK